MLEQSRLHDRTESDIERLETGIFTFENKHANEDGKRVLIATHDQGSYNVTQPIMAALRDDPRCKSQVVLTSGIAATKIRSDFPDLMRVRTGGSIFDDIGRLTEDTPLDISLLTVSAKNGPETPMLFAGKEVFGAQKTYLLLDGWLYPGGIFTAGNKERMEEIDGIFCQDEMMRSLIQKSLPEYPVERIFAYGSPAMEHLEIDRAAEYRSGTRNALGISDDAFAVLYAGDTSQYEGLGPTINIDSFNKTRNVVENWAIHHPEKEIALIVRPHPNARNTADWDNLLEATKEKSAAANLYIKDGSPEKCTMNEAAYAADAIVSIWSTENFYAPMRGRRGVFLGFSDLQLDTKVHDKLCSKEVQATLKQTPGISVVSSEQMLTEALDRIASEPPPEAAKIENVTKKIVDTLFRA